jgi:ABC-type Fe3+/spermidine/putrescine transport system ATPase subunit
VVQVADPATIYNRPASRFVANFIGETNFLPGTVQAVAPDRVALNLANETIWTDGTAVIDVGQPITLAVRPEKVYVVRTAGENNGRSYLPGIVQQIMYLGTDTRYAIRLNNGQTVVALARNLNGDGPLYQNEAVHVYWHQSDARILTD